MPQYNRENLSETVKKTGIKYQFAGHRLGGRPEDPSLYNAEKAVVDYDLVLDFQDAIDRLIEHSKSYRMALVCSEHDPIDCHRCLLVGRALTERQHGISHIMKDGSLMTQSDIESRLLEKIGGDAPLLEQASAHQIHQAYRKQNLKAGYKKKTDMTSEKSGASF
jgi:hypothetical protein